MGDAAEKQATPTAAKRNEDSAGTGSADAQGSNQEPNGGLIAHGPQGPESGGPEAPRPASGAAPLSEADAVAMYAEADRLEAKAKALKAKARARALEMYKEDGLASLHGDEGTVIISEASGSWRFNKDKARAYLTDEQWEACFEQGQSSTRVQFKPRKVNGG